MTLLVIVLFLALFDDRIQSRADAPREEEQGEQFNRVDPGHGRLRWGGE